MKKEQPFLFQTHCYNDCPKGSSPSKKNKYLCELECPSNKPYEDLINHICIENCDLNDRLNVYVNQIIYRQKRQKKI